MSPEAEKEFIDMCLDCYGPKVELTGKYRHLCLDWDLLPIDETCEEFKACRCFHNYGEEQPA
jgi:hypothetical protein